MMPQMLGLPQVVVVQAAAVEQEAHQAARLLHLVKATQVAQLTQVLAVAVAVQEQLAVTLALRVVLAELEQLAH
jgi:hypothetical protein